VNTTTHTSSSTPTVVAVDRRHRQNVRVGGVNTQFALIAAQLAAGLGNLIVSMIAARLLAPGEYAQVVSFLALYFAVHVPAAALSAAGAINPSHAAAVRRRALPIAIGLAIAMAAVAVPLGAATGLGTVMIVILAAAFPGAAGLGLARGEAYGRHDVRSITASFVAEPATRAVLGVLLMWRFGAPGAAVAAVLGGYASWAICAKALTRTAGVSADTPSMAASVYEPIPDERARILAIGVGITLIGVAVLQVIDLIIANARLDDISAGQFGALSTLGGAAAFATATVPMALLPDAARGSAVARRVALRIALATGAAITLVGWVAAGPLLRLAFGDELAGASRWLGPYLVAMAAIGVIRVQITSRWTQGDGTFVRRAIVTALVVQMLTQAALGATVGAVVLCTLAATGGLAIALAFTPTAPLGVGTGPFAPTTPVGRLVGTERHAEHRTFGIRTETLALVALCAAATLLRVATTRGLWVDEAISVRQAQLPFTEMLADMRDTDVHPPLHHALLWVTVRLAGTSEFAVRLPSLIAGVALVPAMLWTGRVLYDRRTGWVAAALGAIAPFCVWYSQEARMYSLFMLFATLAVGAQVQAIRRGSRSDWLLYAAATAALIWTQYFALLPVAVQQLAFAVVAVRRHRISRRDPDQQGRSRDFTRAWLISTALIAAALLPLLPILYDQFTAYNSRSNGLVPGQAGAASSAISGGISVYAVAANMVWAIWGYHADGTMVQITALWPLLMLLLLVLLGRGRSGRTMLLMALVAVPMAALFLIGSIKRDLFELRYFSGAVPVLLLLLARLVTVLTRARRVMVVAAVAMAATLSIGLVDQQINGANPRLYDFEGALAAVAAIDAGPDAVLLYEPSYLGDVIEYYAPDLDTRPLGSAVPADASTVWVLAAERVLDDETISGRVGTVLAQLEIERTEVSEIRQPNVRVWELK
jgi:4-amino-4-deoxy-L-arabinose transferase-like glycosyltransferase/O-antigen/teichoic acid export membrane protein